MGRKELPLPCFPRQHPVSNDWLMWEYKVWLLQLQTFLKCHPSFRVSCENCHDLCCNCIVIQFIPLFNLAAFTPLQVLSRKALPSNPPAHNLHLRICLPQNAIYYSYEKDPRQHCPFLLRSLIFFTSSTSSFMLITVKARSYHFLCLIREKIYQRGKSRSYL